VDNEKTSRLPQSVLPDDWLSVQFESGSASLQGADSLSRSLIRQRNSRFATELADSSWLTGRVHRYEDGPVAFVLTAGSGGLPGSPSKWFGRSIFWADDAKPGRRLGIEAGQWSF
jgi:hypothetical protein